jgi:hypothetical protein
MRKLFEMKAGVCISSYLVEHPLLAQSRHLDNPKSSVFPFTQNRLIIYTVINTLLLSCHQ